MYSSRYVLQRRLSQSSVTCPPYMISPNRYLRSSHGTFTVTPVLKIVIVLRPDTTATRATNETAHLSISLQVVVQNVDRDRQVSGVEGVFSVPTLRPKLPPLCHTGMEVTQREQDGLELLFPAALVQDVLCRRGGGCNLLTKLLIATAAFTWSKLSRAACRLACMPVGGSLVILMAFSRIP